MLNDQTCDVAEQITNQLGCEVCRPNCNNKREDLQNHSLGTTNRTTKLPQALFQMKGNSDRFLLYKVHQLRYITL